MKRFRLSLIPVLIAALFLVGCPPPEEEPKEKPATPEEIRQEGQEILNSLNQLMSGGGGAAPGRPAPGGSTQDLLRQKRGAMQAQPQQLRAKLQSFREKHGNTETGQEMIPMISSKLFNMANTAFQVEQYQLCVSACDLVLVIDPTHGRAPDLRRQAQDELDKPKVELKGFYQDQDAEKLLAWVNVTYRKTNQTESRQVKVADEFDGYRLKKIIQNAQGRPTGILIRYIKTGKESTLSLHD
jgi:hypothetical protein